MKLIVGKVGSNHITHVGGGVFIQVVEEFKDEFRVSFVI